MDDETLREWADKLLTGDIGAAQFRLALAEGSTAPLDGVALDLDRRRRCGHAEVIFGSGKSVAALQAAVRRLRQADMPVLVTRIDESQAAALREDYPAGNHNPVARTWRHAAEAEASARHQNVAIVTAGTSDLPVAEEARETLAWMRIDAPLICDVGVAGPHRLLPHLELLRRQDVVIVVAGMEGALPSVVAGHLSAPVIAVPTSVGYGASFGGVAALLGMLNSCAANVAVVNIDAGFKAGYLAGLMVLRRHEPDW